MEHHCFPHLRSKRIFLTGHTGFKGSWLVKWLADMGNEICGFALPPATQPSHFEVGDVESALHKNIFGDIRDLELLTQSIHQFEPDLIMHLAAQSVVSQGYSDPIETFSSNVMGTANVLEAVRNWQRPCGVLVITSDKCYENVEQVWGYRENDALGEKDPYGGSKGAAELVVRSYRNSFFPTNQLKRHGVWLATARAGNVIGGGDFTENALLVDTFKAVSSGQTVELRSPHATRPWQHVLQCLSGYLTIANRLVERQNRAVCSSFNIGPAPGNEWSVQDVVQTFIKHWGSGQWVGPQNAPQMKEACILRLAIDKAIWELDWRPRWDVETSIEKTVQWYKTFVDEPGLVNDITQLQIREYESMLGAAKEQNVEHSV